MQIIFKNAHYTATQFKDGLIVQSNRIQKGIHLVKAAEWIEAIKTAIDKDEAHALCKAVYNGSHVPSLIPFITGAKYAN